MKPVEFQSKLFLLIKDRTPTEALLKRLTHLAFGVASATALLQSLEDCLEAGIRLEDWLAATSKLPQPQDFTATQELTAMIAELEGELNE